MSQRELRVQARLRAGGDGIWLWSDALLLLRKILLFQIQEGVDRVDL
jgi:hypothetical protein